MVILKTPSAYTANDEITIIVNSISVVTNVIVNNKTNDVVCHCLQVTA